MDLLTMYSEAVAKHDAARPYCIAQLQTDPETWEQKLVLWRRYPTAKAAQKEPDLKHIPSYAGGLYVFLASEFDKHAEELYSPPAWETDED